MTARTSIEVGIDELHTALADDDAFEAYSPHLLTQICQAV